MSSKRNCLEDVLFTIILNMLNNCVLFLYAAFKQDIRRC